MVFIGANEGFPLPGPGGKNVDCCGPDWAAAYANRVRRMMDTYRQGGGARVYWLTLPIPRDGDFAEVARAVNAAIEVAAQPFRAQVRVLDMTELFTPGGKYRDAMTVDGRKRIVRDSDGIHLNGTGAGLAAEQVIDAVHRDFGRLANRERPAAQPEARPQHPGGGFVAPRAQRPPGDGERARRERPAQGGERRLEAVPARPLAADRQPPAARVLDGAQPLRALAHAGARAARAGRPAAASRSRRSASRTTPLPRVGRERVDVGGQQRDHGAGAHQQRQPVERRGQRVVAAAAQHPRRRRRSEPSRRT